MKKNTAIFTAVLIAVLFSQAMPALSLEKLSNNEMQKVTGQAGISAAVDEGVLFVQTPTITIWDVGTRDRFGNPLAVDGHISYRTKALLGINEAFSLDIGMPYGGETITVTDVISPEDSTTRTFSHPLSDMAMVAFTQQSDEPFYTFQTQDIAVYNHGLGEMSQIGGLNLSGLNVFDSRIGLFPPADGCGIRGVAGMRGQVGLLELENPDQGLNASLSGIMIGAAFTGDTLPEGPSASSQLDPGTWGFDAGMFELGIPYYYHDDPNQEDTHLHTHPFSVDIGGDPDRPGDFQAYIALNAPVRGSIRIRNISSDNFDMGAVAIDGIRLYKNVVEFPGRGIGN